MAEATRTIRLKGGLHLYDTVISSIEGMLERIRKDAKDVTAKDWQYAWFRGEPQDKNRLVPKLYRTDSDCTNRDENQLTKLFRTKENQLLQLFRMRAPIFASGHDPDREATDQWLFLAQHHGLPTRLLDWTESALVALHFALLERESVVWMLNPVELNRRSDPSASDSFALTWFDPPAVLKRVDISGAADGRGRWRGTCAPKWHKKNNLGSINIRGAWEEDTAGAELPVAILPTNIHPRMSVQRSCFTVHGRNKKSLEELFPGDYLKKYPVDPNEVKRKRMQRDLRLLGIDHSTVFPDLDGLARELSRQFEEPPLSWSPSRPRRPSQQENLRSWDEIAYLRGEAEAEV